MAEEFKAITTQEEFDAAIKDRLARQEKTIKSQFADYDDLKGRSRSSTMNGRRGRRRIRRTQIRSRS